MQLIKSEDDNYLIGNPKITFFKVVYHRHTNFAMENIEITLPKSPNVNESKILTRIPKSGDLLNEMYYDVLLRGEQSVNVTNYINWTNSTGYAYIKNTSIQIDSQRIDTHCSEWFDIWNELTDINENENLLVNKRNVRYPYFYSIKETPKKPNDLQMYIPLQFWFCRNPGLALPLIALQYSDIKLNITLRKLDFLVNCTGDPTQTTSGYIAPQIVKPKTELYCEYIYLDKDERRQFAQNNHEYLIEQVQKLGPLDLNKNINLDFNHSIKEIIWAFRDSNRGETDASVSTTNNSKGNVDATLNIDGSPSLYGNDYFNFTSNHDKYKEYVGTFETIEPFDYATILFENSERFSKRPASYFRTIQPLNHHSRIPTKHIYSYSFALQPEKHQPTGCCNFTKLNAKLSFDDIEGQLIPSSDMKLFVFAINYNVYRISGGTGALAFANTRI